MRGCGKSLKLQIILSVPDLKANRSDREGGSQTRFHLHYFVSTSDLTGPQLNHNQQNKRYCKSHVLSITYEFELGSRMKKMEMQNFVLNLSLDKSTGSRTFYRE